MSADRGTLVEPSGRLPEMSLPALPDGAPLRLRAGRRSPLLLFVDRADCVDCARLLTDLEAEGEALRDWDARVLVVLAGPLADAAHFPARGFTVLSDPEGRLAAALSLRPPALVVADQWGEVHARYEAGKDHAFPALDEIVSWLRYLAIQCPECQGEAY